MPDPGPASLVATRQTLHLVAAHVLARRRFAATGRCGLRANPGGFATPAFGEGPEVVRVADGYVVREVAGSVTCAAIDGATLGQLAAFAGADLAGPFGCGDDAPGTGDPGAPLVLDIDQARRVSDWYAVGWAVLDAVLARLGPAAEPATIQIWPEHFDAATNVLTPDGDRVNLGFSPGDGYEPEPYLYVGPWSAERRGDPAFWNAPFGAVRRERDVPPGRGRVGACVEFLEAGLANASDSRKITR